MRHFRLSALAAVALVLPLSPGTGEIPRPELTLTGLPGRVSSAQSLILRLGVSGISETEAEVEVSTLLANRSVGRSVWKVPVEQGKGEKEISLTLPEARSRVSLQIAARLTENGATARADSVMLPRWSPERLTEVLRTREIGVVDEDELIATALGKATFDRIAPTDPLGVERFRGDALICHIPQFNPAWDGVVAALAHQLVQGRSVVWLTRAGEGLPPALHSGPLAAVQWPFVLRPGRDLKNTSPEDVLHWAGEEDALPLPLVASFGSAWLVVCPDRLLTKMAQEPAAGWLWEDVLLWVGDKPALPPSVKRPQFGSDGAPPPPLLPGPSPSAVVLSLRDANWVQPSERRLEWLDSVRQFLQEGNAVVVTGADADRAAALRALGLSHVEFIPSMEPPDLMLGPNLLLWRIARTNPSYGLLVKRDEKELMEAYVSDRAGPRLFAEFKVGKGLVLLCQPSFDESDTGLDYALLEHLALQLLTSPGRSLLPEEPAK